VSPLYLASVCIHRSEIYGRGYRSIAQWRMEEEAGWSLLETGWETVDLG
jgi:hypothetical protein